MVLTDFCVVAGVISQAVAIGEKCAADVIGACKVSIRNGVARA